MLFELLIIRASTVNNVNSRKNLIGCRFPQFNTCSGVSKGGNEEGEHLLVARQKAIDQSGLLWMSARRMSWPKT